MSNPLITIIAPVYNVAPYLAQCLDSLRAQTYSPLEIILIDDGSTDGSGAICDQFAQSDSRVVVHHQTNSGLSAARNSGLDLAHGDYVAFLDSDDFLAPSYIEYLYNLASKHHAPISICSHYERKPDGRLRSFAKSGCRFGAFAVDVALRKMLNEDGFMVSAWGKLYLRSLFETPSKLRFPEHKLHEDVGATYKLFLRAYQANAAARIAFGARPQYYYNIRPDSITNSRAFSSRKLDLITQTDDMCDAIDQVFPNLINTTRLRRLHARFSIARQAQAARHLDPCIKYIKNHKTWISQNPEAKKRDKLALASLLLGKTVFKLSWRIYELFFK